VRQQVPANLPKHGVLSASVQDTVHLESIAQERKAERFLNTLPHEAVEHGKTRMLAGKLLHMQIEDVQKLQSDGFLSDKGAAHILHSVHESQRENATLFYDPEDQGDDEVSDDEEADHMTPFKR